MRYRSLLLALCLSLSFVLPARAANVGLVQTTITASCATYTGCPSNAALSTTVSVPANVAVQISGTFVGTLQFEGSIDCANGNPLPFYATGVVSSQTTATAPGIYSAAITNVTCFQVRATSWSSGSASVYLFVTSAPSATAAVSGVTVNNTVTVSPSGGAMTVAGSGSAGSPAASVVTVQGIGGGTNLNVNCASGCASASWTYYNIPASSTCVSAPCVIKNQGGTLHSIVGLTTGGTAQPAGVCTWYDNASAASGPILYQESGLGAGQVVTLDIKFTQGVTEQCAANPGGGGINVLYL